MALQGPILSALWMHSTISPQAVSNIGRLSLLPSILQVSTSFIKRCFITILISLTDCGPCCDAVLWCNYSHFAVTFFLNNKWKRSDTNLLWWSENVSHDQNVSGSTLHLATWLDSLTGTLYHSNSCISKIGYRSPACQFSWALQNQRTVFIYSKLFFYCVN